MSPSTVRKLLIAYVLLLVPVAWLATKYDPYEIDGDAVAYMDISDLIHAHKWAGVVNGYWHPLYPAALLAARTAFHPARMNELAAYYKLNYVIFLLSVAAMLAFVTSLVKLRTRLVGSGGEPVLSLNAMRMLGLGVLVIASQRELSMGKVRPDALLQALMLSAFAMLLQALATESLMFAPLMGMFFGLAYLTKSFAMLVAMLSIAVMMLFQGWLQRRPLKRVVLGGALAFVVFAAIAGPYIAALSKQKGRFDFGDSGALNYAWYSGGTEKMHLEPWMTGSFGSAQVHLVHPEKQLLAHPGIYSYKAEPYGTYPVWFDATFFNERIVPHLNPKVLLRRDARNAVLVFRYLMNHPEAWVLLLLLLAAGARLRFAGWRREGFWLPAVLLGLAMWGIYGLVNIEERYVTLAYLLVLLPVLATLRVPADDDRLWLQRAATGMAVLLAFLAAGESLRLSLEARRQQSGSLPAAWYSPQIFGAAKGLQAMGVKPGDEIACMGTTACLADIYWMRLAGVRTTTEIYNPASTGLLAQFESLPNRAEVYDVLKREGAQVLVANFDSVAMATAPPAAAGWVRLGETNFYALPLDLVQTKMDTPKAPASLPWTTTREGMGP